MKPRAKLFISSDEVEGIFGEGKWRLLNAVKKYGSIQKASNELGRSYRKAWGDIKYAEQGLGRLLVTRNRGGRNGGSTELTDFGKQMLKAWKIYRNEINSYMKKSYERIFKQLTEGDTK